MAYIRLPSNLKLELGLQIHSKFSFRHYTFDQLQWGKIFDKLIRIYHSLNRGYFSEQKSWWFSFDCYLNKELSLCSLMHLNLVIEFGWILSHILHFVTIFIIFFKLIIFYDGNFIATGNEGHNIHVGQNMHFDLEADLDKIIDYAIHTPIDIACLIVS